MKRLLLVFLFAGTPSSFAIGFPEVEVAASACVSAPHFGGEIALYGGAVENLREPLARQCERLGAKRPFGREKILSVEVGEYPIYCVKVMASDYCVPVYQ